jgi:hypothetical protein
MYNCSYFRVVGVLFRGMRIASRTRTGHGCIGSECGGRPSVEAIEDGRAAPVCGGSQGVPFQCRIAFALCVFCAE